MNSLRKFAPAMHWRIIAASACLTLAGSPGFAAPRHAPHATTPAAQAAGAPAGGASAAPAGEAKAETGESPVDKTVSRTNGPPDRGGKAGDGKSVGPIDLARPDGGYNYDNLRRRAARISLIAAQKKPQTGPALTIAPHPPVPATTEHSRNAAGAVVPVTTTAPGAAKAEPARAEPTPATAFSAAKNSVGLSATTAHASPIHVATTPAPPKPPVPGINGTSLHQAGPGIGGPAKDHSAIAGSSFRHK